MATWSGDNMSKIGEAWSGEQYDYVVLQTTLNQGILSSGGSSLVNLLELQHVINKQASKGYRLHTITTTSSGNKGLMGGDRIQATMVFERVTYGNSTPDANNAGQMGEYGQQEGQNNIGPEQTAPDNSSANAGADDGTSFSDYYFMRNKDIRSNPTKNSAPANTSPENAPRVVPVRNGDIYICPKCGKAHKGNRTRCSGCGAVFING